MTHISTLWYAPGEAAVILKTDIEGIRWLIVEKKLHVVQFKGEWRIRSTSVHAMATQNFALKARETACKPASKNTWRDSYEDALKADEARFWSKVDKSRGPDQCWIWTGTRSKKTGRGNHSPTMHGGKYVRQNRATVQAHVWAWLLTHGSLPSGHGQHGRGSRGPNLLHKCGNGDEGCVNPSHLYVGSPRENRRDKKRHELMPWIKSDYLKVKSSPSPPVPAGLTSLETPQALFDVTDYKNA